MLYEVITAEENDSRVALHLPGKRRVDRLDERHDRHPVIPPDAEATSAARPGARASPSTRPPRGSPGEPAERSRTPSRRVPLPPGPPPRKPLPLSRPRCQPAAVITSYSIHYTKLYDERQAGERAAGGAVDMDLVVGAKSFDLG